MPVCPSCSSTVKPEWKFCIYCGEPTTPESARPAPLPPATTNPVAILALALAVVGGVPAIGFGHLAIHQIKKSGERGLLLARIATVLGYLWLVVWVVILTSLFSNAG